MRHCRTVSSWSPSRKLLVSQRLIHKDTDFVLIIYFTLTMTCYAEELQQQAGVFKRNANELKNKMWWKNMKVRCAAV